METLQENSNVTLPVHQIITSAELLEHWQGHRSLTRRLIEVFPEEEFFNYSIGGMRTCAALIMELIAIGAPGIREIVTRESGELDENRDHQNSKKGVLELWDQQTAEIETYWSQLMDSRFHDTIKTFGEYEGTVISSILYFIDNEIHHRGQAYVYLRSLGIEPPYFWER